MKIAVLGTGIVARTIADRVFGLGHEVTIGTRNVANTLGKLEKDGNGSAPFEEWHRTHSGIVVQTFSESAQTAEMIFNCTSGQASVAALEMAGAAHLEGKVLIDLANPLDFSNGMPPSLNPTNTDSLGEVIQRTFPGARVVKTLNTMNAGIMVNPSKIPGTHHVFVSGNEPEAKQQVQSLLNEFGWKDEQIIDLGDITTARGSEMLLPIWLRLWNALGTADFNFHIQR